MKNKKIKRISGRWKFLGIVLFLYIVFFFVDQQLTMKAIELFEQTFMRVARILVVVFVVIFFVNLLVKPEGIKKHLGEDSGFRGWVYTMLGSIFISGPPYVMFPFLGELKKHGARLSLLVIFLNNRNVQPVFLPVMIFYFGTPFTIIISVYILIFSSINGFVIEKILK